jgi:hypothetical protein
LRYVPSSAHPILLIPSSSSSSSSSITPYCIPSLPLPSLTLNYRERGWIAGRGSEERRREERRREERRPNSSRTQDVFFLFVFLFSVPISVFLAKGVAAEHEKKSRPLQHAVENVFFFLFFMLHHEIPHLNRRGI